MTWTSVWMPVIASVIGGLISGSVVLYTTRRQLRHQVRQQDRVESFQTAQKLAEMAGDTISVLGSAAAILTQVSAILSRPGSNIQAKRTWDELTELASQLEDCGRKALATRILATSFADTPDGRRLIAVAGSLIGTPDVLPEGQRALEAHVAKLAERLEEAAASLRQLT